MRKKAYHVTFSIRDACDVRRFRGSFPEGVGVRSQSPQRVVSIERSRQATAVHLISNVNALPAYSATPPSPALLILREAANNEYRRYPSDKFSPQTAARSSKRRQNVK